MLSEWDKRFFELAIFVGRWSKDRSRQVGSVIVGPNRDIRAMGYNGFPRRIDDLDEDRHERPNKYFWTEHSERNAIYYAARTGIPLDGCTMYLPWYPCVDCARAIIQAGLIRLVAVEPDNNDATWGEHFKIAQALLSEAGVRVDFAPADFMSEITLKVVGRSQTE